MRNRHLCKSSLFHSSLALCNNGSSNCIDTMFKGGIRVIPHIILPNLGYLDWSLGAILPRGQNEFTAKGATTVANVSHWSAVSDPPAGLPIKLGRRPSLAGIFNCQNVSSVIVAFLF